MTAASNLTYLNSLLVPESTLEYSVVVSAVVLAVIYLLRGVFVAEVVCTLANQLVNSHCEVQAASVVVVVGDKIVVSRIDGDLHCGIELFFVSDETIDWDLVPIACFEATNMLVDGNKK